MHPALQSSSKMERTLLLRYPNWCTERQLQASSVRLWIMCLDNTALCLAQLAVLEALS